MPDRIKIACALIAVALGGLTPLRADAVVNVCNTDSSPTPASAQAVDLTHALAIGGRISFNCPAGSVIAFTRHQNIAIPTVIDGGGSVTLDGRGSQMFGAGTSLTLTSLTIQNGHPLATSPVPGFTEGGVVRGTGPVTVSDCHFVNNTSAIFVAGALTVRNSSFLNGQGGVLSARDLDVSGVTVRGSGVAPFASSGGAITLRGVSVAGGVSSTFASPCTLRISGSSFSSATATAVVSHCDTTISKTDFTGNQGQTGGALFLAATAPGLRINGGSFSSNVATGDGGAIAFESSTIADRPLLLENVSFTGNQATNGGAINLGLFIENTNQLTGKSLIFANNSATKTGGAITGNAGLNLTRILFAGNSALGSGGALDFVPFAGRSISVANAIFNGNSSPQGSVFHGSSIHLTNVTIANSRTSAAISPFWRASNINTPDPWALIFFRNVAFWNNAAGACESSIFAKLFQDAGHNLQFPAAGCPASIPVVDPRFDSMFIPRPGGAADGAGELNVCLASPVSGVDLFGKHRPQGKSCSIGAVEGDIEDAVLKNNPTYSHLPRTPPSNCQCTTYKPKPCTGDACRPVTTVTPTPPMQPPVQPTGTTGSTTGPL